MKRTVELSVTGMTCAACANRVQRQLSKLDGVSAQVNYATEKAIVEVDGDRPVAELIAQVEKAGYGAAPVEQATDGDRVADLWRRLMVALLVGVPLADLSITMVVLPSLRFAGWQWVLLTMTLPVVTWCAWPFHRKALSAARHGASSMDTLVSLGVVASTAWSFHAVFAAAATTGEVGWRLLLTPSGAVYLDVAAGVTIFMLAGRLFEARAKRSAGQALRALARLTAKQATRRNRDGSEEIVPAASLRVGDHFVVRPGETIATDGVVVEGVSAVDTSAMTGEPAPVEKVVGDSVAAGTTAVAGRLVVRATRVGASTQLAGLVALVERAQHDKAAVQRLADRISSVFVPVAIGLALVTGLAWALAGAGTEKAISTGLAVLIIACPCALGLATPTALLAASGRGAQLGIFVKGQQALESARAIDTVVMDKTGTLTTGRIDVVDTWAPDDMALAYAAAVEAAAEHPIARAVAAHLPATGPVEEFSALAGLGARGRVDGHDVVVGSPRLMDSLGLDLPADGRDACDLWSSKGFSVVLVAVDGHVSGGFGLADTVKPSAAPAVRELKALGLHTILLTGDHRGAAEAVGAYLAVDEVIAEVLPADKAKVIDRLRGQGRTVAMVGDGVNDAPALAAADLGLAVVSGTDVALGAADIILVRDDLRVVPEAVRLARRTLRTIRGNLAWAFGYNVAALPIAASGLLNPLVSSAAMALSSLLVVANSLRLRSFDADR